MNSQLVQKQFWRDLRSLQEYSTQNPYHTDDLCGPAGQANYNNNNICRSGDNLPTLREKKDRNLRCLEARIESYKRYKGFEEKWRNSITRDHDWGQERQQYQAISNGNPGHQQAIRTVHGFVSDCKKLISIGEFLESLPSLPNCPINPTGQIQDDIQVLVDCTEAVKNRLKVYQSNEALLLDNEGLFNNYLGELSLQTGLIEAMQDTFELWLNDFPLERVVDLRFDLERNLATGEPNNLVVVDNFIEIDSILTKFNRTVALFRNHLELFREGERLLFRRYDEDLGRTYNEYFFNLDTIYQNWLDERSSFNRVNRTWEEVNNQVKRAGFLLSRLSTTSPSYDRQLKILAYYQDWLTKL